MNQVNLIRRAALQYLARRDYSQHDIAQKLAQKGFARPASQEVINELVQAGYINDRRFTENYIYWRQKKGYGPLRISAELQARGIAAEIIAEHMDITDNVWLSVAHRCWLKYWKGKIPTDFAGRAKQMRFLQYRGFTREQIDHVIADNQQEPTFTES